MKVIDIQRKLLRNGYIFNVCMQTGAYTAKKGANVLLCKNA